MLLLFGSAAGGVLAIVRAAPRAQERIATPAEIPWAQLDLRGRAPATRHTPLAILYVQRRCPHCRRTAHLVDSLGDALGVATLLITNDADTVAETYARELRLRRPLARDSARAFARRFRIVYVPTLIAFDRDDRETRHLGSGSDATFRSILRGIR